MERNERIVELFDQVLEKEAAERTEFLEKACGDDSEMMTEIRELLDAFNKAQENDFMSASALEMEAEFFIDKEKGGRCGEVLGHYKLIEEIGAGGMGTIYLAGRTDDFEKRTAVKIIKRGMDTDEVLRRFRNERQILADLEHPFIAHLIDGGTTHDGLPFFVMEYVEGAPVDAYCRGKNLSEAARLELFRKICAAVQFAHQKLIIHRDLKPSNILVTPEGEPKLLDFGIAKLLNSTGAPEEEETQTNMRVLTPAYASPEQLRGEIVGTASDVYSLGLVLSEILGSGARRVGSRESGVGRRESRVEERNSLNRNSDAGIQPNIRPPKSQIPNPKSQIPNLKVDLQNILAKSLHTDSSRRYGSAEAFSEDVRRYLQGLPVSARKDSVSYRASKFVKRNRIAVAFTGLFILSLIGGLATTLWQFRNAQNERARAERRFNDVRALVNTFLSELNDEMVKVSGNTAARKLLVQKTLEYLDKASHEADGDITLQRELATAYIKVGDIQGNSYYQNFGDTSGALVSYQKALDILESLVNTNRSDNETKIQLAKSYESMGDVLWDKGDLNAGRSNYQKALKIVEEVAAGRPEDKETQLYLAQLYTSLGDVEYLVEAQSFRDMPAALDYLNKGLVIRERFFAARPDDREVNIYLNQSYQRLINVYWAKGDFAAELEFLQKDKLLMEKLLAKYPQESNRKRDTSICYIRFARYLIGEGDFKQAGEYTAKSMALREALYNADKTEVRAQRDLAFGYYASGELQLESGNSREALINFQKQLKIYEDLAAIDTSNKDRQQDLIDSLIDVGKAALKTGDTDSALEKLQRALEISQTFPADDLQTQTNLANIYEGLGSTLLLKGKSDSAIGNLKKSIALREAETENDKLNAMARTDLAKVYLKMGESIQKVSANSLENTQEAKAWYQKSMKIWSDLREKKSLRKIDGKFYEETANALAKYDRL